MTTMPPSENHHHHHTKGDQRSLPTPHVIDALPEYIAGMLDAPATQIVRKHVLECAACNDELRAWQRVAAVEHDATQRTVAPSLALLDRVWAEIDAPVTVSSVVAARTSPVRTRVLASVLTCARAYLWHSGYVSLRQVRLLGVSFWLASAVGMLLAMLYALLLPAHDELGVSGVLTFALPLIAATGTAFLYGPETDKGIEFALATPTSSRTIMVSRFLLLLAYNTALALLATLFLAQVRGFGFWALAQHWLGPMALLSSISLMLSLLLSPPIAVSGELALWLARALHVSDGISFHLTPDIFWQTTPQMLVIAVALLLLAALYVSRQERIAP